MIIRNTVDEMMVSEPAQAIHRTFTVSRASWELGLFLTMLLSALWIGSKHVVGKPGQAALNAATILSLAVLLYRQRGSIRSWGLLPANAWEGLGSLTLASASAVAVIAVSGYVAGTIGNVVSFGWWMWRNWYIDLAQQIILQLIVVPRFTTILGRNNPAGDEEGTLKVSIVTAVLFAILHLPNVLLTGLTFVAAIFWCEWFRRYRNLPAVWLSHFCIAAATIYCLNGQWLANLRVGISYILRSS